MSTADYMQTLGTQARAASREMARASTQLKNQALLAIADDIEAHRDSLKAANGHDMSMAWMPRCWTACS